jgi:hypothetical protein
MSKKSNNSTTWIFLQRTLKVFANAWPLRKFVKNNKPKKCNSTTGDHGYQELAEEQRIIRRVNGLPGSQFVYINVHRLVMTAFTDGHCGIQDKTE